MNSSTRSLERGFDSPLVESLTTTTATKSDSISSNFKPFPTSPTTSTINSSSHTNTKDADSFDAIVQAANPAHPQHAVWKERYGGSIRNVRKSMEGSPPSPNSSSMPNSVRKPRSKSIVKNGKTLSNPSKVRPALDERMMPPRTGGQNGQMEHIRALSSPTSPKDLAIEGKESTMNDKNADGEHVISENKSDATIGGATVSERSHRRKKKKDKGKGKASAPPVPPPRTTSHAAYQDASIDASFISQEGFDRKQSFDLRRQTIRETDVSNGHITGTPSLQQQFYAYQNTSQHKMNHTIARVDSLSSTPLQSPLSSNFPQRQSSVSPEIGSESPTSMSSSPQLRMASFANLAQSLSGRRSIDFRLPEDEVNKTKTEGISRSTQRRGLDAIFSPLRSAVTSRRMEKQQSITQSPQPGQSEPIVPQPILRHPTNLNVSNINEQMKRIAPTPPPRSPLRRTPLLNSSEDGIFAKEGVEIQRERSPLTRVADLASTEVSNSGTDEKTHQEPTIAKEMTSMKTTKPTSVNQTSYIMQSQEDSPPMPTQDTTQSNQTFISFLPSLSHKRSVSGDTEEGQEFHDAMSDEGGNGSSADDKPQKSQTGNVASTVRKRRSRRKSVESSQAARLQAKESALIEPMPEMSETDGTVLQENVGSRRRRDSSASEDMIPLSVRRNSLKQKGSKRHLRISSTKKDSPPVPPTPAMQDQNRKDDEEKENVAEHSKDSTGSMQQNGKIEPEQALVDRNINVTSIESDTASIPKDLPEIPVDLTTPKVQQNVFESFPVSHMATGYINGNKADSDDKKLPLPPPIPLPPLPRPPSPEEMLKRQITHQRSFSRSNQNANTSSGGKISGVFSRMRKDKTPSYSHLPRSDSRNTSMTTSTSQFPIVSPSESPVQNDSASGIGLGIETMSMQSSSKGTSTSDQHYQPSIVQSPSQTLRSSSSEGGWRTRFPSFSAGKSAKVEKGEKGTPPPLPLPRASIDSGMLIGNSVNGDLAASREAILPSPTIHKTLSPALLRDERHEADEVASFIGSDDAQEERLADSRRGTWNSFSNFELAPDKVFEAKSSLNPIIDIQMAQNDSSTKSSNLTSDSVSMPMTPSQSELNSHLKPSNSFSSDGMHLSMTARRLSRSSSTSKQMFAPQALDLSPGKLHSIRGQGNSNEQEEHLEDSRASPFSSDVRGQEVGGSLAFPSSPGRASIASNGTESKRVRNMSIGSTLLNSVGTSSKPRSSFAADRDRSPVVNQIWADLPPSPSPKVSNVRKFFTSSGKNPLRLGKLRTTSSNALMPEISPNDGSFPISPALPSGHSGSFAEHWKKESSPQGNGSGGYPLTQSASTSSSFKQMTNSSNEHSSSNTTGSPIAYYRQTGTPRGMPGTAFHSSSSLATGNSSLHHHNYKEYIGDAVMPTSPGGSIPQEESFYSLPSSRSINSQRMIDSSTLSPSNSTNDTELEAFGKMLRESAKEDAQRVRQIAQRSVSVNNTPNIS